MTGTGDRTATGQPAAERPGGLRRVLHRLTSDNRELEALDLQDQAAERGATPIAECPDREQVRIAGTIRSLILRPRGGVPALEAELYDGSATATLVWLGRRTMVGIEPGVSLVAYGRVSTREDGGRVLFNPRYELDPPAC